MGPVIKRRAELRAAVPLPFEQLVVGWIEGQADRLELLRTGGIVAPPLIVVAQVDDRPHPIRQQGRPARVGEPLERVRADDGAATRLAAPGGRQAAEVANVETA